MTPVAESPASRRARIDNASPPKKRGSASGTVLTATGTVSLPPEAPLPTTKAPICAARVVVRVRYCRGHREATSRSRFQAGEARPPTGPSAAHGRYRHRANAPDRRWRRATGGHSAQQEATVARVVQRVLRSERAREVLPPAVALVRTQAKQPAVGEPHVIDARFEMHGRGEPGIARQDFRQNPCAQTCATVMRVRSTRPRSALNHERQSSMRSTRPANRSSQSRLWQVERGRKSGASRPGNASDGR